MRFNLTSLFTIILAVFLTIGCGNNSQQTPVKNTKKETSTSFYSRANIAEINTTIPDSTDTFTPNPYFENYLTDTPIFGKDFTVILDYPKEEKRHPLKNNQFLFRIKGNIESKTGDAPTNFKLRLFTNQIFDFKTNKARDEWAMEFEKTDNFYQFKMGNILMNIDAGIYYYTIEKLEELEPYYIGKISLL